MKIGKHVRKNEGKYGEFKTGKQFIYLERKKMKGNKQIFF